MSATYQKAEEKRRRKVNALAFCQFCGRRRRGPSRGWEENPFCNQCLHERVALAIERRGPVTTIRDGRYIIVTSGDDPKAPPADLEDLLCELADEAKQWDIDHPDEDDRDVAPYSAGIRSAIADISSHILGIGWPRTRKERDRQLAQAQARASRAANAERRKRAGR